MPRPVSDREQQLVELAYRAGQEDVAGRLKRAIAPAATISRDWLEGGLRHLEPMPVEIPDQLANAIAYREWAAQLCADCLHERRCHGTPRLAADQGVCQGAHPERPYELCPCRGFVEPAAGAHVLGSRPAVPPDETVRIERGER